MNNYFTFYNKIPHFQAYPWKKRLSRKGQLNDSSLSSKGSFPQAPFLYYFGLWQKQVVQGYCAFNPEPRVSTKVP
jgi:hypothetical protein